MQFKLALLTKPLARFGKRNCNAHHLKNRR